MDKELEELLRDLASSNFYFQYKTLEDEAGLLVAKLGDAVHIGPKCGTLSFDCSQGASAYPVLCINSYKPGVIGVRTLRLNPSVFGYYIIHQTIETMPKVTTQTVSTKDYKRLASKR